MSLLQVYEALRHRVLLRDLPFHLELPHLLPGGQLKRIQSYLNLPDVFVFNHTRYVLIGTYQMPIQ